MIRRPPRSTRTYTLFPYTTLFRSFDTISATGAHGASPHYHSTPESNAELKPGDLYLVDSGGQYDDGTTDVTCVLPVGEPRTEERRDGKEYVSTCITRWSPHP